MDTPCQVWGNQIRRQVSQWNKAVPKVLDNAPTACLIGYSFSGKSTFCQLVKKCVGHENSQIKFQKSKYLLKDVISSNSMKICTTSPKAYKIGNFQLVDIPATVLPPQVVKAKGQPQNQTLQSKLLIQFMLRSFSACSFIIVMTQSNTKLKIQPWKRLIYSFLDYFENIPEQFYNSVGFLITKSSTSPALTQQNVIKRLQNLIEELAKDSKQLQKKKQLENLLKTIIKNKSVAISFKGQPNDEYQQQRVTTAFNQIKKIEGFKMDDQNLKIKKLEQILISDEQQNQIKSYWSNYTYLITNLLKYLDIMLFDKIKTNQEWLKYKNDLKGDLGIKGEELNQDKNGNKFQNQEDQQKPDKISILKSFYNVIMMLKVEFEPGDFQSKNNKIEEISRTNMIQQTIDSFYENGLFHKDRDWQIKSLVRQFNRFYIILKYNQNKDVAIRQIYDSLNSLTDKKTQEKLVETICQLANEQDKNVQFYEILEQIIQKFENNTFFTVKQQVFSQAKSKIQNQMSNSKDDISSLKSLMNLYKSHISKNKFQQIRVVYVKLSKILKKYQRSIQAIQVLKKGQFKGGVVLILQELSKKEDINQKLVNFIFQQLDFLIQMGLYQKAKQIGYYLDAKMDKKIMRKKLADKIKQILEIQKTGKNGVDMNELNKFSNGQTETLSLDQISSLQKVINEIKEQIDQQQFQKHQQKEIKKLQNINQKSSNQIKTELKKQKKNFQIKVRKVPK